MGIFVGAERQAIVDDLAARFDATAHDEAGVAVVVLASPPGWGKTRIVQELYERLAAEQLTPRYWPPAIEATDGAGMAAVMQGRKRIYPRQIDVEAGASMPWMWWGVLCHNRDSGEFAQAWSDDATQVWAHADAIVNRAPDKAGRVFDATGALVGLVGLAGMAVAAPLGVALTVGGAARTVWSNKDLTARLEAWRQRRSDRTVDAATGDRGDRAVDMAESLAQVARQVPVILVIDDAHDADDTLTRLIAHLAAEVPAARVLVVATAWPQALDAETSDRPFARWLADADPRRVTRIDLSPLESQDLEAIVVDDLTNGETRPRAEELASIATMVVDRVNGNTLGVRALLRLEEVQDALERGQLTPHDLALLPGDLDSIFHAYWNRLPREVRQVLARGAYLGTAYVPPVVVAAAIADGIDTAADAVLRGVDPYAWVRPLNDDLADLLHAFVDPLLHERANHEARRLTADQREHLHQQVVAAAVDAALASDLPAQVRSLLWQHHINLAREGLVPTDSQAARSAFRLATRAADTYDYASAIALGLDALSWAAGTNTLGIRKSLATWYQQAGRVDEAITCLEGVLADQVRVLGADHPDTLRTRGSLAALYGDAGRADDAITILDAVLLDCTRVLGSDHPITLLTRSTLATWQGLVRPAGDTIATLEVALDDCVRVLGPEHLTTLTTRWHVATIYGAAGRIDDAISAFQTLLDDQRRVFGPDNPNTLVTMSALASWELAGGRTNDAVTSLEGVLEDQTRVLGPDHPTTLLTRVHLANGYDEAERTDDAIAMLTATIPEATRLLGADHVITLTARSALVTLYWTAERNDDARTSANALLEDQTRVLGTDHPSTLQTRFTLAMIGVEDERLDLEDTIRTFEEMLIDCTRVLGEEHPITASGAEMLLLLRDELEP